MGKMRFQKLKIESDGLGSNTHVWLDGKLLPNARLILVRIEAQKPVQVMIDLLADIDFEGQAEVDTHVLSEDEKELIREEKITPTEVS